MKKLLSIAMLGTGCFALMNTASAALVEHFDKTVQWLETDAVSSCIFFKLTGVNEANPAVPSDVYSPSI